MASYVGLDYGTTMLKAAGCEAADAAPRVLNLAGHDPYVPAAVERSSSEEFHLGWDAWRRRRTAVARVAVRFRDRLLDPDASLTLGGERVPGLSLQTELLRSVRRAVQSAAGDVAGVVVAVPDGWASPRWSLPQALAQAGWAPTAFVREWVAASAGADVSNTDRALFLSLGGGSARAVLCQRREGTWHRVTDGFSEGVSGEALRRLLFQSVGEKVVRAVRRDPRESADTDQALTDALEAALTELHRRPAATIEADILGQHFRDSLSTGELATIAQTLRAPLEQLVGRLVSDPRMQGKPVPIVVWGELTGLLPIGDWLAPFQPPHLPVQRLTLDVVAAGAAKLAARWSREGVPATEDACGGLCPNCGAFAPKLLKTTCSHCSTRLIPLIEQVDASTQHAKPRVPACALIVSGGPEDGRRMAVTGDRFRLGRHPLSEGFFAKETYPSVSAAHAVIVYEAGRYQLNDLGSTNGTFVNGTRIERHPLAAGDQIQLGQQGPQLRFECSC